MKNLIKLPLVAVTYYENINDSEGKHPFFEGDYVKVLISDVTFIVVIILIVDQL